MWEESSATASHPEHEMNPGGFIRLNTGFAEYTHEAGGLFELPPDDLYEDFERDDITVGTADAELVPGLVELNGGASSLVGMEVDVSFDVPSKLDVWVLYDDNLDDELPAEWVRGSGGRTFTIGDGRDYHLNILIEGSGVGSDQVLKAEASATFECTGTDGITRSRAVGGEDSIRLHVVDLDIDVDSDNDAGFKAGTRFGTIEDEYVEWLNEFGGVPQIGKLAVVNDGDMDYEGVGDGVLDFADGFNADKGPNGPGLLPDNQMLTGSDPSLHEFVPLRFALPKLEHGTTTVTFEYDAADPEVGTYDFTQPALDPYDLRLNFDYGFNTWEQELGAGTYRLWTKPATAQRDGRSVADGGDYIDSVERDPANGQQRAVEYTYADLGIDPAEGGEVLLYVESVRPSPDPGEEVTLRWTTRYAGAPEHGFEFWRSVPISPIANTDEPLPPLPTDQTAARKFTRVDARGVPLPDPSPAGDTEEDRRPNLGFVDAFSLTPSYGTTDVAVPVPGGELLLEVRRRMSIGERLWDDRSIRHDFWPSERLLGPAWDTNLGTRLLITTVEEPPLGEPHFRASVVDESGTSMSYTNNSAPGGAPGGGGSLAWLPEVWDSFSSESLRAHLGQRDDGQNGYMLTKEHGTKLYFAPSNTVDNTREGQYTNLMRIDRIVDRNGNELRYAYGGIGGTALANATVPTAIYDPATTGSATPRRIDFGYTGVAGETRLSSVTDPLGRTIDYHYYTSGAKAGLLREVVRPSVAGPDGTASRPTVTFDYDVDPRQRRQILRDGGINDGSTGWVEWFTPTTITDARGHVTTFDYTKRLTPTVVDKTLVEGYVLVSEVRPHVRSVTTGDGTAQFNFEKLTHGDRVTRVTDTRGVATKYEFDADIEPSLSELGFAISVTEFRRITDPGGANHQVTYRFSGHDALPNQTNFAALHGNLVEVEDVSGNVVRFDYDSGDSSDAFNANPYGWGIGSHYALSGNPSSSTLAYGDLNITTQYRYETVFNKLVSTTDAAGVRTEFQLDALGNRTHVTEAAGTANAATMVYDYFTGTDPDGAADGRLYTGGFVTRVTDADGRVVEYVPDALGHGAYTIVKGLAGEDLTPLDDHETGGANASYPALDPNGNYIVTRQDVDVMGRTLASYDPTGDATLFGYDALDRLLWTELPAVVDPHQPAGSPPVTSRSWSHYDLNGNLVRTVDPNGNEQFTYYDALNRPTATVIDLDGDGSGGVPLGQVVAGGTSLAGFDPGDLVTRAAYDAVGLSASATDARGQTSRHFYDELLRLTRTELPAVTLHDGTVATYETTYAYGPNSGSGAFTLGGFNPTRVVNARGYATDTAYDAAYRAVQVVQRGDAGQGLAHNAAPRAGEPAVLTEYNAVHNPVRVTALNETLLGNAANRNTYTFYDHRHRVVATAVDLNGNGSGTYAGAFYADGNAVPDDGVDLIGRSFYDASGNVAMAVDPLGRGTETDYDGAGRATETRLPAVEVFEDGTLTVGVRPTTLTSYDADGNAAVVTDANGHQTKTFFDARNRQVRAILDLDEDGVFETNGDDVVTETGYDLGGRAIYAVDPRGFRSDTEYDRANRPEIVRGPEVADAENGGLPTRPETLTEYDANGNVVAVTDPRGVVSMTTYDELNRPRFATAAAGTPVALTTESRYDANGNVVALVLDNGSYGEQVTTYTYDAFDRQLTETLPAIGDGVARVTTTTYNRVGEPLLVNDPKGQSHETAYDRAGRVTQTHHRRGDGSLEEQRVYTQDQAGNVTRVTDLHGASEYDFDALNRVIQERRFDGATLESAVVSRYDALGNRTKVEYPDATGVASSGRDLVSTFDARGLLTSVTDMGGGDGQTRVTSYAYDLAGNRTLRSLPNGVDTVSTFDALGRVTLMEDRDAAAALVYSVAYAYDLAGQRRTANEQWGGAAPSAKQTSYGYDAQYRLIEETFGESGTGTVLDTFTRPDSPTLGNAETGQPWEILKGEWRVEGGEAKPEKYLATAGIDIGGFDGEISATAAELSRPSQGDWRLVGRSNPFGQGGITLHAYKDSKVKLSYTPPGQTTPTMQLQGPMASGPSNGDRITLRLNGNTAEALVNGVVIITMNNLPAPAADQVYFGLQQNTDNNDATYGELAWDDVEILGAAGGAGGGAAEVRSYTYDLAGNRLTKTINGDTTSYTYNALNELGSEYAGDGTTLYTYDANGNPVRKEFTGGTQGTYTLGRFGETSDGTNYAGTLDLSFGRGGRTSTNSADAQNDYGRRIAVQPDGKVLLAGGADTVDDLFVVRYNPDGSLDATFGDGGKVLIDAGNSTANAVALQDDGKIVLVGSSGSNGLGNVVVARLLPDGSLDTSFDTDGIQSVFLGGNSAAFAVAIAAEGKIVAGGHANSKVGVLRFLPDGSLDTTFDGDGVRTVQVGGTSGLHGLALLPDGRIVGGGFTKTSGAEDLLALRLNADGSSDTSFGNAGSRVIDLGGTNDQAFDLALDAAGKLLLAGRTGDDFALARLDANGTGLDTSFGGDGIATVDFGNLGEEARGVAVDDSGRILLAGGDAARSDFLVARLNSDGSNDLGFGSSGKTTVDFGGLSDYARAVAVDAFGRVLVGGETLAYDEFGTPHTDVAVARLHGEDAAAGRAAAQQPEAYGPYRVAASAAPTDVGYRYDTHDRLIEAYDFDGGGGGDAFFQADYDARTRRLAKREALTLEDRERGVFSETTYRYDGGTSYQDLNEPGEVLVEHARAGGLGGGIGSILYADRYSAEGESGSGGSSLTTEYFAYNAVGHTSALTDAAGAVTQSLAYDAFGNVVFEAGTGQTDRLANTKERDASLGLDNHGFRYYDPSTGRYLTRDPIGYGDGPNVYLHVGNNPVNGVDPLGLEKLQAGRNHAYPLYLGGANVQPGIKNLTDRQHSRYHEYFYINGLGHPSDATKEEMRIARFTWREMSVEGRQQFIAGAMRYSGGYTADEISRADRIVRAERRAGFVTKRAENVKTRDLQRIGDNGGTRPKNMRVKTFARIRREISKANLRVLKGVGTGATILSLSTLTAEASGSSSITDPNTWKGLAIYVGSRSAQLSALGNGAVEVPPGIPNGSTTDAARSLRAIQTAIGVVSVIDPENYIDSLEHDFNITKDRILQINRRNAVIEVGSFLEQGRFPQQQVAAAHAFMERYGG